jgi:O-antigen/teichoic acid export membrane protein
MAVTALFMTAGLWMQLGKLKSLLSARSLAPAFNRDATQALFDFGIFSWLQAVSGVVFNQLDRLLLGVSLGAVAVASYALCAQMAQPIFGFAAAGLHFLFPYLSNRSATSDTQSLKDAVLIAFACNLAFVVVTTGGLLLFGDHILHIWAGPTIAQNAATVLNKIIWSSGLLGLNVTATYTLLALGRVRIVTALNLAAGAAMMFAMLRLAPRMGIQGIADAKLIYSLIPLLLYIPLARVLFSKRSLRVATATLQPVCEER